MSGSRRKTRERLRTVGFMMGVTAVAIAAVSGLHGLTAEQVKRNAGLFAQRAVLIAAGIDPPAAPADLAERFARYAEAATPDLPPGNIDSFYRVRHPDDDRRLHVRRILGTGLWGGIDAMVGLDPEQKELAGIAFLDHNETPGLGARIEEPWFRAQFSGKRRSDAGDPIVYRDEDERDIGPHAFNGITGATTTTRAVADIVNRALTKEDEPHGGR